MDITGSHNVAQRMGNFLLQERRKFSTNWNIVVNCPHCKTVWNNQLWDIGHTREKHLKIFSQISPTKAIELLWWKNVMFRTCKFCNMTKSYFAKMSGAVWKWNNVLNSSVSSWCGLFSNITASTFGSKKSQDSLFHFNIGSNGFCLTRGLKCVEKILSKCLLTMVKAVSQKM